MALAYTALLLKKQVPLNGGISVNITVLVPVIAWINMSFGSEDLGFGSVYMPKSAMGYCWKFCDW